MILNWGKLRTQEHKNSRTQECRNEGMWGGQLTVNSCGIGGFCFFFGRFGFVCSGRSRRGLGEGVNRRHRMSAMINPGPFLGDVKFYGRSGYAYLDGDDVRSFRFYWFFINYIGVQAGCGGFSLQSTSQCAASIAISARPTRQSLFKSPGRSKLQMLFMARLL